MTTNATLCYVLKDDKILLIKKKRGVGQGFWNGPGGRIEPGEGVKDCAVREVKEEIGIDVLNPEIIGEMDFYFGKDHFMKVHVLKTDMFQGSETETDEAEPKWFPISELPFHEMWPDDELWMPLMLDNRKFKGVFFFDDEGKNLLNYELTEI